MILLRETSLTQLTLILKHIHHYYYYVGLEAKGYWFKLW